jgi:N-dimethylarginine dimethylaminohydrolase
MTTRILMCPPDYFDVTYVINPWMSSGAGVDRDLARHQWDSLKGAIENRAGAEVVILEPQPGLPDLVFTANAAFVQGDKAIIAHYKYPERQPEEPHADAWFRKHGYVSIRLPDNIFFEGAGDALIWRSPAGQPVVLAGYRTRTDIASHNLITTQTGLPVLSLELSNPNFYHIDVCLCPLADGSLIYYPGAFDDYGRAVIEANVPPEKRILAEDADAMAFGCNAVNVGNTVILNHRATALIDQLRARGYDVVPVDLSEFIKAGGSAKCLTLKVSG